MFDLTDIESLTHCQRWKEDACESASDPYVFLVGTKKDLCVSYFEIISTHPSLVSVNLRSFLCIEVVKFEPKLNSKMKLFAKHSRSNAASQ